MAIPNLNEQGLLPPGIHNCSLEEIGERFGTFQSTDLRPLLYEKLQAFHQQVRSTNPVIAVIVNGSFVTGKANLNDIDSIIMLPSSHDLRAELAPMAYNVLSRRRVARKYGFDILVAREDAIEYTQSMEFFQQLRGQPHLYKGVLRIGV